MTVTVNITREADIYGVPIREKWKVSYNGGDYDIELRVMRMTGSKAMFVLNGVSLEGMPDEVLDTLEDRLEDAAGVPR